MSNRCPSKVDAGTKWHCMVPPPLPIPYLKQVAGVFGIGIWSLVHGWWTGWVGRQTNKQTKEALDGWNYVTYGNQMVKIAVGGRRELQRAETDVVESLVVNAEGLVRVLH